MFLPTSRCWHCTFILFPLIWRLPSHRAEYLRDGNIYSRYVALPGCVPQGSGGDRSCCWEQTTTWNCRSWFSSVLWSHHEGVVSVSCQKFLANPSVLMYKCVLSWHPPLPLGTSDNLPLLQCILIATPRRYSPRVDEERPLSRLSYP